MSKAAKPQLVAQLQGQHTGPINDAIYVPDHHAAISVSDDKNVLIWLRRDDGTYWPSVCHPMPFAPTALCYHHESRRLFVGMDQGSISEYVVSEDFNSMTTTRTMPAHSGRVRCIIYDHERQLVLSGAHDKCITLSSAADGKRLSAHSRPAWVTSLQYDEDTQNVFVGDYRGLIGVLKIVNNKLQFISNLEGHDGDVRSLLWVPERGYLFSGSFDKTVICWDVGGNKGISYELTGHRNKVRGLAYVLAEDILMSTGDDGMLALWNMKAERTPTPTWQDGDLCALCSEPFFWNFKAMWHKKSISFKRQHHCRRCGKAVCDKCSPSRQAYPVMGFEFAVRFCSTCATEVKDEPYVCVVWNGGNHGVTRTPSIGPSVLKLWLVCAECRVVPFTLV
ncbi:uncharacterized protein MONBRDRAFT_15409 [Monosiga brevicollis MX1]|uniref:FYVE-type domain-containing protein n=1 Tax=Monosiga brevicollis TaxID=81824 RepID=A9USZ9_MONBE|nr:uncharacterized protein MONBRDRAFT_15409 [Monosiga brevicollis MX1]EDQ91157.1 predicted protein [Monosiga brevicollis MX1]|eukprot:XP_001743579.1 hypothetical protein [Monosiga brevicollis MX1]